MTQYLTKVFVALCILGATAWLTRYLGPQLEAQRPKPAPVPTLAATEPALEDAGAPDAGLAAAEQPTPLPSAHPLSAALCPDNMVWAGGEYCPLPTEGGDGCKVAARELSFCIDQFEYPNQRGVAPANMIHFYEAERLCKLEGKRLCTESEWTHACRDPVSLSACNFGRTTREIPVMAFRRPDKVSQAVSQFEGRRRSAPTKCASRFGAFDMLGNLREWTTSDMGGQHRAALKGGRYNQSSINCERSIQTTQLDARLPHTGFRCCQEPLAKPKAEH